MSRSRLKVLWLLVLVLSFCALDASSMAAQTNEAGSIELQDNLIRKFATDPDYNLYKALQLWVQSGDYKKSPQSIKWYLRTIAGIELSTSPISWTESSSTHFLMGSLHSVYKFKITIETGSNPKVSFRRVSTAKQNLTLHGLDQTGFDFDLSGRLLFAQISKKGPLDQTLSMTHLLFEGVTEADRVALRETPYVWNIKKLPSEATLAPYDTSDNRVVVALIDGGVDYSDPDLAPFLKPTTHHSERLRLANELGLHPRMGWDFESNTPYAYDFRYSLLGGETRAHGSAVMQVLVAGDPKLYVLNFRYKSGSLGEDFEYMVRMAKLEGAKIINLSVISMFHSDLSRMREVMVSHPDMLFVQSVDNERKDIDPLLDGLRIFSDLPNVILVGAVNREGEMISDYGKDSVHVFALGEYLLKDPIIGRHRMHMGASFATPVVSRIAASVLTTRPQLQPKEVRDLLVANVRKSPLLMGKSISEGVVDNSTCELILRRL